jgi:hypothetical protein
MDLLDWAEVREGVVRSIVYVGGDIGIAVATPHCRYAVFYAASGAGPLRRSASPGLEGAMFVGKLLA